jgi:hypothetical protein
MYFELGSPVGASPTRVANGGMSGGGQVSIACIVESVGNGFDVSLRAAVGGASGGSFEVTSPSGQGAVTTSGAMGIQTAAMSTSANAAYQSSACTLSYTYKGTTVPDSPPVTAGRIWGHVSCMDAAGPAGTCDLEADFLFEQCTQ